MGTCCAKPKTQKQLKNKKQEPENTTFVVDNQKLSFKFHVNSLSKFHIDIQEKYKLGKIVGQGKFGIVRVAQLPENPDEQFAVKSIPKIMLADQIEVFQREVETIMQLDHPNIVKICEVFEDSRFYHIVMEYCEGGELLQQILDNGPFSEKQARSFIKKLIQTCYYMHKQKIIHRDIKADNILFTGSQKHFKLVDFGLARITQDQDLHSIVGTSQYMAPEVFKRNYGFGCDVWSIGIILYFILSGQYPFQGNQYADFYNIIMETELDFTQQCWSEISSGAIDLISQLLEKNCNKRITLKKALKHQWFSKNQSNSSTNTTNNQ